MGYAVASNLTAFTVTPGPPAPSLAAINGEQQHNTMFFLCEINAFIIDGR
jgi:hypothetical protein